MITLEYAEFLTRLGCSGQTASISAYEARLVNNSEMTVDSVYADLSEIAGNGYAPIVMDDWTMNGNSAEFQHVEVFENTGEAPWPAATYLAVNTVASGFGSTRRLAWFIPLGDHIVGPGEKLNLAWAKFRLASLAAV
ncbi:MAG: hypothetical protein GY842_06300 [bacterium]|nr:hypothetical protein [bacterium]